MSAQRTSVASVLSLIVRIGAFAAAIVVFWIYLRPALGLQANSWDEFIHTNPMGKFMGLILLIMLIVFGVGGMMSSRKRE